VGGGSGRGGEGVGVGVGGVSVYKSSHGFLCPRCMKYFSQQILLLSQIRSSTALSAASPAATLRASGAGKYFFRINIFCRRILSTFGCLARGYSTRKCRKQGFFRDQYLLQTHICRQNRFAPLICKNVCFLKISARR
jgi:hypothetical protein